MDENTPPPAEIQTPAPVQAEDNAPPEIQAAPETSPETPPAANLVISGEVTDERVLAAERRAESAERARLEAERRAAELERDNQLLKEIPRTAPPAPSPKPRKRRFFPTILGSEEGDE
jgi:uncharacterized protein YaiL (DUF2058 family)